MINDCLLLVKRFCRYENTRRRRQIWWCRNS